MVFPVSSDAQEMFGCVATTRCRLLLQPSSVGQQVAYSTQFEAPFDRAISAREKVNSRLIGDLNRREWELPPKPKWMRWYTYERLAAQYQLQQSKIDQRIADYVR
jgi:hypothetical protein